jgi:hypothetical protein
MSWLTPERAIELLGADIAEQLDPAAFEPSVAAAAEYVESHRTDLYVENVFTPGPAVEFGTALLALRWFSRRRAPLGGEDEVGDVLADDPDLGRMLGIGTRGRSLFGAPTITETVV